MHNQLVSYKLVTDKASRMQGVTIVFDDAQSKAGQLSDDIMATIHPFLCFETDPSFIEHKIFVQINQLCLMGQIATSLPKEQVVLLIAPCDDVTEALIARCEALFENGYLLGINNLTEDDNRLVLLPFTQYVTQHINLLSNRTLALLKGHNTILIATHIHSLAQKEEAERLGCQLFQGWYYLEIKPDPSKKLPLNMRVIIELIAELNSDGCDSTLEKFFRENPTLSLQMLKLVNSAAMGVGKEVNSIRHAIMILGRGQMMRWLQVMLYAQDDTAKVPTVIMYKALWRAELMELLSTQCDHHGSLAHHDSVFMTGMLSLADILLNESMENVIPTMGLSVMIQEALLHKKGIAGMLLKLVEALEQARFDEVKMLAGQLNIDDEIVATCQKEALVWANKVASGIGE